MATQPQLEARGTVPRISFDRPTAAPTPAHPAAGTFSDISIKATCGILLGPELLFIVRARIILMFSIWMVKARITIMEESTPPGLRGLCFHHQMSCEASNASCAGLHVLLLFATAFQRIIPGAPLALSIFTFLTIAIWLYGLFQNNKNYERIGPRDDL